MNRFFRIFVCFLLICAVLVNISPIRAEASAGALLGTITGVTSVNVPAGLAIGAAVIALGVACGSDTTAFDNIVTELSGYLSVVSDYITDGYAQLLQCIDSAGKKVYYIGSDLLEEVRRTLIGFEFDPVLNPTGTVTVDGTSLPVASAGRFTFGFIEGCYGNPYCFIIGEPYGESVYCGSRTFRLTHSVTLDGVSYGICGVDFIPDEAFYFGRCTLNGHSNLEKCVQACINAYKGTGIFRTEFPAFKFGNFAKVPVDGSSALDWSQEYAAKRIYVTGGSNDPDPPDENNGKWFWPIALPLTAATLYAMSQADEWSGETPQEFDNYTQNTEFEILDRPEFGEYQSIVIQPVTSPSPNPGTNPDPGTDPDPTAPGEPNPDPEPEPDPEPDPDPEPSPDPGTDPDVDPDLGGGSAGDSGDGTGWIPPNDHTIFALPDLKDFFPFCIPFDLYAFFQLLNADPVAPVLSWEINDLAGQTYALSVDLAEWDSVAQLFRRLQLFLFICGLAAASRKFIKW